MMPTDTNNTTLAALAVPGIEPDSVKFASLLARLTAPERGQVMDLINSLLVAIA